MNGWEMCQSVLVKELEPRFRKWFNRRQKRSGTLRAERFKRRSWTDDELLAQNEN